MPRHTAFGETHVFVGARDAATVRHRMNFEAMPELHWKLGYPLAIALMVGACGYLFYLPGQSGWL
jgi:hypothetical protein